LAVTKKHAARAPEARAWGKRAAAWDARMGPVAAREAAALQAAFRAAAGRAAAAQARGTYVTYLGVHAVTRPAGAAGSGPRGSPKSSSATGAPAGPRGAGAPAAGGEGKAGLRPPAAGVPPPAAVGVAPAPGHRAGAAAKDQHTPGPGLLATAREAEVQKVTSFENAAKLLRDPAFLDFARQYRETYAQVAGALSPNFFDGDREPDTIMVQVIRIYLNDSH